MATLYFTIFAWFQRGVYENFEARRLKTVAHLVVTLANAPLVICVRTAVPSSDIEQQSGFYSPINAFLYRCTRPEIVERTARLASQLQSAQRLRRGIGSNAAGVILVQALQYTCFLVVANTLTPALLGMWTSANVMIAALTLLADLGVGVWYIRTATPSPQALASAFWLSAVFGTGLSLLAGCALGLGIPGVQLAWRELVMGLLPVVVLVAVSSVPRAHLEKTLAFGRIAVIESIAMLVNVTVTLGLLKLGAGVWALAFGLLALHLVQSVLYWLHARLAIQHLPDRAECRQILRFGLPLLGTRGLGHFNANIDYVLIGSLFGTAMLGQYALAYKLVTYPMLKVSSTVMRVAYPIFAQLQNDLPQSRDVYRKLVRRLAWCLMPALVALAVYADRLIPALFGAHWEAAVVFTRILVFVGLLKALSFAVGLIYVSQGRPDMEFRANLMGTCVLPLCLWVGTFWGPYGLAWGFVVTACMLAPYQVFRAHALIGLTTRHYLGALKYPLGVSTLVGAFLYATTYP